MPEMPEVETIARQLRKTILGKRIVEVRLSGLPLRKPVAGDFSAMACGRRITGIHRRGKYLLVELAPKAFLLIHLGMSGRILYLERSSEGIRHVHAVFRFSDSTVLEYRDPRRFGLLSAYEVQEIDQVPELLCLGMDPLDRSFTGNSGICNRGHPEQWPGSELFTDRFRPLISTSLQRRRATKRLPFFFIANDHDL